MSQDQTVMELCSITSCDPEQAQHLLEACHWDLDAAINLYFETGYTPSIKDNKPFTDHEEIRAPIPQTHGRLVDNSPINIPSGFNQNLNFPDLSNFIGHNDPFLRQPIVRQPIQNEPKTKFDKIFAPPTDIMFVGTFEGARDLAQQEHKWVLINIQSQSEFDALKLNRDVWSDDVVKSMISAYFVFWQADHKDPEGARFVSFYDVTTYPTISIIDPQTGEVIKSWKGGIEKDAFLDQIQTFLEKNSEKVSNSPLQHVNAFTPEKRTIEDVMDEDDELARAIAESLNQPNPEMPPEPIVSKPKYMLDFDKFFSTEKGQSTRLQIRFPNGKKDLVNLNLKTPLCALYSIIHSKLEEGDKEKDFTVMYLNNKIENTDSKTIEDMGIVNASISFNFE